MGCYSHLSDDEREQIGLAEALGHSIGAIAQAIGRPKSTVLRELCRNRLPSGRYSPLHAAGAYQLRGGVKRDRKRSSLTDLRCRPARGRVDPGANFRLAQGRKRTSPPPRAPGLSSRASGWSSLTTPRGFPCFVRFSCVHAVATTPAQRLGVAHFAQSCQPSPIWPSGRPAHRPFRDAMGRRRGNCIHRR